MLMPMTISYHSTSSLEEQVKNRFKKANLPDEYKHAVLVRAEALELASAYGLDRKQVSVAALLHNISHLIPTQDYLRLAQEYGIEILAEEKNNPYLLHQKISRIIAVEDFNISDKEVLNAISCHTTLRKSATLLDKIIFLAAKQYNGNAGHKAFQNKISSIQDLNESVFSCLFNEINNQINTANVHPWAKEALQDLKTKNTDK